MFIFLKLSEIKIGLVNMGESDWIWLNSLIFGMGGCSLLVIFVLEMIKWKLGLLYWRFKIFLR